MGQQQDVIALVSQQHSQAVKRGLKGLIIQPGAIGDCILTLPLAYYVQKGLGLGAVDILGHMDYLSIFPGRSCIDAIRSIDLIEMHRLFQADGDFLLVDQDPLISAFAEYTWIISFLGGPGSHFETNLIYTAMCSHSAEVMCLPFHPPDGYRRHISEFYISQFKAQCGVRIRHRPLALSSTIIRPTAADRIKGSKILAAHGVDPSRPTVLMHPGSGAVRKCWHVDNYIGLAGRLAKEGIQPVFVIGRAEQERFGSEWACRLSHVAPVLEGIWLEEVLAVLSVASAHVGNDTGVSHMAGGMGVRTFVLFGPTDPNVYRPVGPKVTVIRDKTDRFAITPCQAMQEKVLNMILAELRGQDKDLEGNA
ncbi:MAG: glycosyltransferase family 9 protein [Sedimentisphaerales bacterium]|nr:glycosyltransferase family 9 protein [Sedimentisphaerales bacterium]